MGFKTLELILKVQGCGRDYKGRLLDGTFSYNKSLEKLRSGGYQRHLRPNEIFKIIIGLIEDPNYKGRPLFHTYHEIKEEMLGSYGEWLSLAMFRKDKETLICYLDPETKDKSHFGTVSNPNEISYSQERQSKIDKDIKSEQSIDLNKFPSELVEFLYSRKYEDLPQVMKEGDRRAQLYLPREGEITPCRRNYYYSLGVFSYVDMGASRGIRIKN